MYSQWLYFPYTYELQKFEQYVLIYFLNSKIFNSTLRLHFQGLKYFNLSMIVNILVTISNKKNGTPPLFFK